MLAVKAYYDGNNFVPLAPVTAQLNQVVIVTILDEIDTNSVRPFEKYIGKLPDNDFAEITEALQETSWVDINEW